MEFALCRRDVALQWDLALQWALYVASSLWGLSLFADAFKIFRLKKRLNRATSYFSFKLGIFPIWNWNQNRIFKPAFLLVSKWNLWVWLLNSTSFPSSSSQHLLKNLNPISDLNTLVVYTVNVLSAESTDEYLRTKSQDN